MIYLKGISYTSTDSTHRKAKHFKRLNIPFKSLREIEKFRFEREKKKPGFKVNIITIEK